jgi:hypothetical protein
MSSLSGADTLVVPYLFTQTLDGSVDIALMGADISTTITPDATVRVYVGAGALQDAFEFDAPAAGPGEDSGEPTRIVLSLAGLPGSLNDAFVAGSGGDRTATRSISDGDGVSITIPHGYRLNWLTSNNYEEILDREDTISEISSNIPALSNLWGHAGCVLQLSNADVQNDDSAAGQALKALYYRAAAAGKINSSGETTDGHWDLSEGDEVHVYVKYTDDLHINYEFATETFTNVSGDFTASQLTDNFASGVVVYFGDSTTPVTLQDASSTATHTYLFQFTVSGA